MFSLSYTSPLLTPSLLHTDITTEFLKTSMISKSQEKWTEESLLSCYAIPEMRLWNLWEVSWRGHEQPQQERSRNILDVLSTKQLWLIPGQRGARNLHGIWFTLQDCKTEWQSWSRVWEEGQQNGGSGMKHNQGFALLTTSFTIDLEEENQKQFSCRMKWTTRVDEGWGN